MKLIDIVQPLHESPFTPKNFPGTPNKKFVGAGERTVYGEMPVNQPGGGGFRIMKPTKVVRGKGGVTELKPNTRIYWTQPGKLFTAAEIGEKGTSNYAMFGLKSPLPKDAIGMIVISTVEKPSQLVGRVLTGKAGQEQVYEYLIQTFSNQFSSIELVKTAGIGSKKADLVVSFDQHESQFEIKNASTRSAPITLFDKTVRREKPNPIIDGLIAVMTGRPQLSLVKLIDKMRVKDKTVGFPGDKGVGKSGKFYGQRIYDDSDFIVPVTDYILEHFAANQDNYFAVNYGGGDVALYFTGYGENILNAPDFPTPKYVDLNTYGGPSAGGMRIGVKIKL